MFRNASVRRHPYAVSLEVNVKTFEVNSLSLPALEPYLTMRRPVDHREKGIFVAEGEKVVRRLVQSDLKIISVLMTHEWFEKYMPLLENREINEGIYVAERKLLEEIVGYRLHQGIMAIGRVPGEVDVLRIKRSPDHPCLLVALDGITNSENMGVIVRNCAAFGVDAMIAGETTCDPYLRRSVRNSMGTIFQLPVVKSEYLLGIIQRLRDEGGFKLFAAHPQPGSIPISDSEFTGDVCIVFGSEGEGISRSVLEICDAWVSIPMQNEVDSINVASSVGVALYEADRQRTLRDRRDSHEKV